MAASKSWSGGVEVIPGFPIHLTAFPVAKSTKNPSFKMLDPKFKQPVSQEFVDVKGKTVERDATLRGAELPGGNIVPLTEKDIDAINAGQKTKVLEPDSFAPVDSLPLHLSDRAFYLVPDSSVAGSARPAGIFWNGLRANGLAFIAEWQKKANEHQTIVAIVADDRGLIGYQLPYPEQLYERPPWAFDGDDRIEVPEVNEQAQAMFGQFIEANAAVEVFDHSRYHSKTLERRRQVIETVLKGGKVKVEKAPAAPAGEPDLMAALSSAVAKVPGGAKPKRRRSAPRPGGRGAEASKRRKTAAKTARRSS